MVLLVASVLWVWSYWEFNSVRHVRSNVRDRVLYRSALSITSACGELLFQSVHLEVTGPSFKHAAPAELEKLTTHPRFGWSSLEKSLAPFWSLPGKSIWNRMGFAKVDTDRTYEAALQDWTPSLRGPLDILRVRESRQNVIIPHWFIVLLSAPLPLWEGTRTWIVVARSLHARRDARRGRCSSCGYDLRATADPYGPRLPQCPECGNVPAYPIIRS